MNKQTLRDYLEQVRLLEMDVYTTNKAIDLLKASRQNIPPFRAPDRYIKDVEKYAGPSNIVTAAVTAGLCVTGTGVLIAPFYLGYRHYKGRKAKKEHEAAIEVHQQQTEELRAAQIQYERNYHEQVEQITAYNDSINAQITRIEQIKSDSQSTLIQLYDLGIIYPKWRSLIPITMFCEYMDSGRRDSLSGINGMYDLYEQELIGKIIVGELQTINNNLLRISYQLGSIANQLSGIQRNQVLLYEEVAKSNLIANEMCNATLSALDNIDRHMVNMESAAKLTAFNTEAAARRTDAIARIAEYEYAAKHSIF